MYTCVSGTMVINLSERIKSLHVYSVSRDYKAITGKNVNEVLGSKYIAMASNLAKVYNKKYLRKKTKFYFKLMLNSLRGVVAPLKMTQKMNGCKIFKIVV